MTCTRPVVEREVEVVDVRADSVGLRLIGDCRGCGGCSGRCGLLDSLDGRQARLHPEAFPMQPAPGEHWRLSLDESSLRSAAAWGYGLPLAGMLTGAALGSMVGWGLGSGWDVATLLGAVAGTSLAFGQSKRLAPQAQPMASRVIAADMLPCANPSTAPAFDPQPSKEF